VFQNVAECTKTAETNRSDHVSTNQRVETPYCLVTPTYEYLHLVAVQ